MYVYHLLMCNWASTTACIFKLYLQLSLGRLGGRCFHGNQRTAAVADVHSVSASSYHHFQLNNNYIIIT